MDKPPYFPTWAAVPEELKSIDAWVNFKLMPDLRGKMTKVPYVAGTNRKASSTDPNTWSSFRRTVEYARVHLSTIAGIGFVVSPDVPYTGIDLDHVIDIKTGEMESWAINMVYALRTYTEVSPSGTGVRMFVRGKLPVGGRHKGQVEMYDTARFFTVTGNALFGSPLWIGERTEELAALHLEVFGAAAPPVVTVAPRTIAVTSRALGFDDGDLLDKAMSANNGGKFRSLWFGQWTGYPSHSEADEALCSHLLFWCGGDAVRADALFRHSGLMRDQWDVRHSGDGRTYGQLTMDKAVLFGGNVYNPDRINIPAPPAGPCVLPPQDFFQGLFRGH